MADDFNALEQFVILISGSLLFVAALAWRDFGDSIFTWFFPNKDGIFPKLFYALIVSGIVLLAIFLIIKWFEKTFKKIEEEEEEVKNKKKRLDKWKNHFQKK